MRDLHAEVADLRREVAALRRIVADSGISQRVAQHSPAGAKKSRDADEECEGKVGNIRIPSLAGRVPNTYQFLLVTPDDCLMLVSPKPCSEPSSSSGSGGSSSSSSETEEGCENCDGATGDITFTLNPGVFWHYGGGPEETDLAYGSETPFDIEFGADCTGTTIFPKYAGPGNQTWEVHKTNPGLFQIACLNTEGGIAGVWELNVEAGNCCPSGSATLTSYGFPTPNDPISISSSGGPC